MCKVAYNDNTHYCNKKYLKKLLSVLLSSNSSRNFHPKMAAGRDTDAPPSGCYQKASEFRLLFF